MDHVGAHEIGDDPRVVHVQRRRGRAEQREQHSGIPLACGHDVEVLAYLAGELRGGQIGSEEVGTFAQQHRGVLGEQQAHLVFIEVVFGLDEPSGPCHENSRENQLVLECLAFAHRHGHLAVELLGGALCAGLDDRSLVAEVFVHRAA